MSLLSPSALCLLCYAQDQFTNLLSWPRLYIHFTTIILIKSYWVNGTHRACTCIRKCISFSREQDLKKDIIVNSCIKIRTVGDKESTYGYRESVIETGRREDGHIFLLVCKVGREWRRWWKWEESEVVKWEEKERRLGMSDATKGWGSKQGGSW